MSSVTQIALLFALPAFETGAYQALSGGEAVILQHPAKAYEDEFYFEFTYHPENDTLVAWEGKWNVTWYRK